jgi:hypothetical protein
VATKRIRKKTATAEEIANLKTKYREAIIRYEKHREREIESIWNHRGVEKVSDSIDLDRLGLFSQESASVFGLGQRELIITGASAGALGGMGIDLALGGSTFFLGSIIGGAVGGVGAMLGFDNLYEVKILGRKVGKREISIVPMKNLNFPYIFLGRALYHASIIANRSHAIREGIRLRSSNRESFIGKIIDNSMRDKLEKVHSKLREGKEPKGEELKEYREVILKAFEKILR